MSYIGILYEEQISHLHAVCLKVVFLSFIQFILMIKREKLLQLVPLLLPMLIGTLYQVNLDAQQFFPSVMMV